MSADDAGSPASTRRSGTPRPRAWVDVAVIALAGGLVFVVHPFGYLTRHPYWVDEVWVALLAKAPLSRYITLSSSTPVGWLLLVRFAPFGRDRLRLVPLLFACGDVAMAYAVARGLPWKSTAVARFAGALAAALVLLAPISLVRHDLKQYTADAFFTLLLVFLAGRVEGSRSFRSAP